MHPWLSLYTLFGPVLPSRCAEGIICIHCIICSAVSSQCTYISDSVMLLAFMYCPSRPIYYSLCFSDPLCSCYDPHILNPLHPSMSVNVLMVRCILLSEGGLPPSSRSCHLWCGPSKQTFCPGPAVHFKSSLCSFLTIWPY